MASVVESQSTASSAAIGISTATAATDTSTTGLLARQPPIGIETAAASNPTHVYFAKNAAYFPFNSWLSFSDCVVFHGDIIFILSTAVMFQIILRFLSFPGTCAYSGLPDVGNRHDVLAY